MAQLVKNLSAMRETWVRSLGWEDPKDKGKATHSTIWPGWEDPMEKGKATHSSISCLENFMDRGAWRATVHGVARSRTHLSD